MAGANALGRQAFARWMFGDIPRTLVPAPLISRTFLRAPAIRRTLVRTPVRYRG
jgi:hypothetical protein